MNKIKVYVAGPYTKGNVEHNVNKAIYISDLMLQMGFHPYCPHLCHFHHIKYPQEYNVWLELVMAFMEKCDVVFRIEGESEGADLEVQRANELGIPVFNDFKSLVKYVDSL